MDIRICLIVIGFLVDPVVAVATGGNLRQVSDAYYLMMLCYLFQLLANDTCGDSADTGVDFVKYQCRDIVAGADYILKGKHDP